MKEGQKERREKTGVFMEKKEERDQQERESEQGT